MCLNEYPNLNEIFALLSNQIQINLITKAGCIYIYQQLRSYIHFKPLDIIVIEV